MSTTKKVLFTVLTILLVGALTFLIAWGVTNFNKVQEGMSGTGLYTQKDIDEAYRDGYNTALTYKDTLQTQVDELRTELSEKQSQLDKLKNVELENANLSETIEQLEIEIANMTQKLSVYEEFIEELKASDKFIATFIIDGVEYKLQSYNSGDVVDFPVPEATYCRVNSWSVNGEVIDTTNYVITSETTFVADVTFPCMVTFVSDDVEYKNIICYPGESFEAPANPVPDTHYVFAGWSLDGETITSVNLMPDSNVTYYAVFDIETVALKLTYETTKIIVGQFIYYFTVESACEKYTTQDLINIISNGNEVYLNGNVLDLEVKDEGLQCDDSNLISCGMAYGDILAATETEESFYINVTFIKG